MATLSELYTIAAGAETQPPSDLFKKVLAACGVVAYEVFSEDPSVPNYHVRQMFAKTATQNPADFGKRVFWNLLGANASATQAQIEGASDALILQSVRDAFDRMTDTSPL